MLEINQENNLNELNIIQEQLNTVIILINYLMIKKKKIYFFIFYYYLNFNFYI